MVHQWLKSWTLIRPRSGEDFVKSDYFSPKLCRESLDLVYLCRIWLFWLSKFAKSNWKLVEIAGEFARIDIFGRVRFHGFWTRGLKTDLPASGFGTRDLQPTTGAIGSGERRSGMGELGGWPGGLDSPNVTNSSNLKILLAAKFFTSSIMKIKKYLVTKP